MMGDIDKGECAGRLHNANLSEFFVVGQLTAYFALDTQRRDAALPI